MGQGHNCDNASVNLRRLFQSHTVRHPKRIIEPTGCYDGLGNARLMHLMRLMSSKTQGSHVKSIAKRGWLEQASTGIFFWQYLGVTVLCAAVVCGTK